MDLAIESLGESIQNLVRLETQTGSSYINVSDEILLRVMTEQHNICLHEVLLSQQSKIFFDIDLKITKEQIQILQQLYDYRWERRLMGLVMDQIIQLFKENNAHLQSPNYSNFDVFRSSRNDQSSDYYKVSWHLVLFPALFCADKSDLRFGAFELNKRINVIFKQIHPQLFTNDVNLIDNGVYRNKGNFRIAGCSKPGVNVPKKVEIIGDIYPQQELPSRYLVGKTKDQQGNQLQSIKLFPMEQFTQQPALKSQSMNTIDPSKAISQVERITKSMQEKLGIRYIQHKFLEGQIVAVTYADYGIDGICPICMRHHDRNHLYSMINLQSETVMLNCFRNTNGNATGAIKPGKYMDLDGNDISMIKLRQQDQVEYMDISSSESEFDQSDEQSEVPAQVNDPEKMASKSILQCFNEHMRTYEDIDWPHYNIQVKEIDQQLTCEYPVDVCALFVKSQMGTGKTKQLMAYMENYVTDNPGNRIVILSFRVSFSNDHRIKINKYFKERNIDCEFKLYSELPLDKISDCQYLIIQVESLQKLGLVGIQCDLFIMDESESLVQQLNSNLSPYETLNFCIFEQLLMRAGKVLCMDAFLSIRTVDTVCKIRDKKYKRAHNVAQQVQRQNQNTNTNQSASFIGIDSNNSQSVAQQTQQSSESRLLIHNKQQEKKSYNFFIGEKSSASWLQILVDDIKNGKKVVVPCNVALVARTIYDVLCSQFPDMAMQKQICLYTQDINKHQKKIDLDNIQEAWKQYTVLIYSPTILAGISFEQKHYDKLHGYFKSGINPVENFMQMCGRVRNLEDKTYNILIIEGNRLVQGFKPVTLDTIDKRIKQDIIVSSQSLPCGIAFELDDQGDIQIQNQGYYRTFLHNQRISNLSMNSPLNRFLVCIGYKYQKHNLTVTQKQKSEGQSIQEQKKELRKRDFEEMKNANMITKEQAHILFSLSDDQLNDRDRRELEKYNLRVQLQVAHISRDIVHEMESLKKIQQWQFLVQYMKMRKQFTTTRNYISQYRLQNVVNNNGDNIVQKSLEYDAQMLINQTVDIQQIKVFEILLNAIGLHQDIFYSRDPDTYDGITVENWLTRLCAYYFLLTVQEVHLKQFNDIALQRFALIKITKAVLQQINTQNSMKQLLRQCINKEILIMGKKKEKKVTREVVKIVTSILSTRFGMHITDDEGGQLHFQPDNVFMETMASDRTEIKIQNFDNVNSSLRKVVTLMWVYLDKMPEEHSDQVSVNICSNQQHYNEYQWIPRKMFDVIKNSDQDVLGWMINTLKCEHCAAWWKYAVQESMKHCLKINDFRQIIMINNYNYYNQYDDPIISIQKSLEDIKASQKYHY